VLQRLEDDPFLERDMPAEQYVYPSSATMACVPPAPAQAVVAIAAPGGVVSPVPIASLAPGTEIMQQRIALQGHWQQQEAHVIDEADDDAVVQLLQMGFEPDLVVLALQQAGNDVSLAMEMLVAPQFPDSTGLSQQVPAPAQPLPPPGQQIPFESLQLPASSPMTHVEPPWALPSHSSVPASPSVLVDSPVVAPPAGTGKCSLCDKGVPLARFNFCVSCEATLQNLSL
jgi:hypothetical protein